MKMIREKPFLIILLVIITGFKTSKWIKRTDQLKIFYNLMIYKIRSKKNRKGRYKRQSRHLPQFITV